MEASDDYKGKAARYPAFTFRGGCRTKAASERYPYVHWPGFWGHRRVAQFRYRAPAEASVEPFLKTPDTSSHGFTLGLCDSLRALEE